MPDASRPPSPRPAPSSAGPRGDIETLRDRLSAAARERVARPKAILLLYAALAVAVLVIFVGQFAGWWPSPIAERVLERRRAADAARPAPTTPSPAPSPSDPLAPSPQPSGPAGSK